MVRGNFSTNGQTDSYLHDAEGAAGRFVFSSSQGDSGTGSAPLRGNDRLLLI